MKGLPFVLLFTAMTFVAWGAYGPVLHHGALAFDHDSMRAFVGVGLAYFMIAVLIPLGILRKNGEVGAWTFSGVIYSVVAGSVGAIGALGIILALGYGGRTVYVMPLVFGFAPVVNTLVTAALSRTFNQISPVFIGGIVAAALGAGGVLFFKPVPVAAAPVVSPTESGGESVPDSGSELEEDSGDGESKDSNESEVPDGAEDTNNAAGEQESTKDDAGEEDGKNRDTGAESTSGQAGIPPVQPDGEPTPTAEKSSNVLGIVFSIIIAALCWGSYGPMLHIGQAKMKGSRLRPFACVGLAYFLIAVVVPLVAISSRSADAGAWTASGMIWSFLAGIAGAIGALGVLLAFNAGGKPYYVMPLIFGFAPVINTFISLSEAGTWALVKPMFWVSLAVVIAGAVTVLVNAPRPKPQKPATAST